MYYKNIVGFKTGSDAAYKPQALGQTNRILLPPRFSAAAVLLLLLVTSAVVFVLAQPDAQQSPRYAPPASPIARAEAAPALPPPAIDPRLDEVAALMPAETNEALPAPTKLNAAALPKAHPISLTIIAKPKPALARQPSQLEALTAQGIALGRQGDYAAAEQALRSALALDRTNPTILYNLGVVAERRGDTDSARTLYEATLRQAADRPDTPLRPDLVTARLDALDAQGAQPQGIQERQ